MYTPFSAGKTFGNQETKIILCAFSYSIYSSPIHNLFAVSFGMKSQKRPMQLSYLLFCSIAEQSMRLQSFAQWILPIPIQPFRDPGPSRISKLIINYVCRLVHSFLPFSLFFLPTYLSSVLFSFFFSRYEPRLKKRGSIEKSRLDWKMETRLENGGSIGKSRLDCVIEPRLSQSGKTRYRGRFRSRVFGLVYQKP